MRPPDLSGGNLENMVEAGRLAVASMRPPDLPGGNSFAGSLVASDQPSLQ